MPSTRIPAGHPGVIHTILPAPVLAAPVLAGPGFAGPAPRAPGGQSRRCLAPRSVSAVRGDLAGLVADLVEVWVWTATGGGWQEHAWFLLRTRGGWWHRVEFAEPAATELAVRLQALPGFDAELLLELLGHRTRRMVTLWRGPSPLAAGWVTAHG